MSSFPTVLALALCIIVRPPLSLTNRSPNPTLSPTVGNNFSINIDDHLKELYLDGVQINPDDLPNADQWNIPDTVPLPDSTKVIAVLGQNEREAAIMVASDLGGWALSDQRWKYSNIYFPNWTMVNFDDSSWNQSYVIRSANDGYSWSRVAGVSRHASLIWSPNFGDFDTNDNLLYFRLKLNRDFLRRDFDSIETDVMVPKKPDCFRNRRLGCASSCSLKTSLCVGFQHSKDTDTCCLLSAAELVFGERQPAIGWKIWSSIVIEDYI